MSPFTGIQVWDAVTQSQIQFDSTDIAESKLGFIIENTVIQSTLTEKIKQLPQVTFISPVKLVSCHAHATHVDLTTDDGRIFSAKLAVAADGAQSWLREQAGIDINITDYEQTAIVATVTTALPHQKIARQVFLESGPLAFLPLEPEHLSSIVWSVPGAEAKRLLALDEYQFRLELAQAFSHRLGDVTHTEQRFAFPLQKQQAHHYIKPRVALIGDAAHTVHPLAGQGVNMGLLDAVSLASVISEAIQQRRDFSSSHQLRRYERWRKADNFALMNGIDAIKNIFASDKKTIQGVRAFGLDMVNRMTWIKNIFTRHARGKKNVDM